MKTILIGTVFISLLWSAGAWADVKEGLWEITTQMSMQGMPHAMPPTTFRQCITKSDPVPRSKDENLTCKTINQKVSGNTVHYTVECKGPEGSMQTTGNMSYRDKTMTGESTTIMKIKGQPPMQMMSKVKGKFIGACTK